jgi:hypothetical protein
MKSLLAVFAGLTVALSAGAATVSFTNTSQSVTYTDPGPIIDATTWWNSAPQYRIFSSSLIQPFMATSLHNFTNTGNMFATPGFRFLDYEVGPYSSSESPLQYFGNSGMILSSLRFSALSASIVNSGRLICNDQGVIVLNATNTGNRADLKNAGLQAGLVEMFDPTLESHFLDPDHNGRNRNGGYTNDFGVTDIYWGQGQNDRMFYGGATNAANLPNPVSLDTLSFLLSLPESPFHQVVDLGFIRAFTNSTFVPQCGGPFLAHVYTNNLNPSNHVVRVVYVATNTTLTNFQVQVGFVLSNANQGYKSIVQFSWADTNIVDGRPISSFLYLSDSAMSVGNPGLNLNLEKGTFRPNNYELSRLTPNDWFSAYPPLYVTNALPPDFFFYPQPFFPGPLASGSITNAGNVGYSSYSAWLGVTNFAPRLNPLIIDSTNLHGKVEIFADSLNATNTRIRAENFAGIQTRNLENNRLPKIDAPFANLDVGAPGRTLVVSNALPEHVIRFFGALKVYSATYSNVVAFRTPAPTPTDPAHAATNYDMSFFHVMIVDNNCLQPPPVTLDKFRVKAGGLVVEDNLNVNNSMLLDVPSLSIGLDGSMVLPLGASWSPTNVPSLQNLTNNGTLEIGRDGAFTTSAGAPLGSFVNHGTIIAGSLNIKAGYFENTDTNPPLPGISSQASMACNNGTFSINATTALLTNGFLTNGSGPITITAGNLDIRSTTLGVGAPDDGFGMPMPGTLTISASGKFGDGSFLDGTTWRLAGNDWQTTGGFEVNRLPTSPGDLLGTTLRSTLVPSGPNRHVWPARDRGASALGFTNNLALGRLVLDSPGFSIFSFEGPDVVNRYALYVDYLDLRNDAINFNQILSIAPNFTIYFANASYPPRKLDGQLNGRLVWVHEYGGPNSGTNFVYVRTNSYGLVTTNYYTFNIAEIQEPDFDSDWDGTVNPEDPSPIFTPSDIDLVVSLVPVGLPPVINTKLTWTALANATNFVEYSAAGVTNPVWKPLITFKQTPPTERVSYVDPTPVVGEPARLYRIREDAQWPPR